MTDEQRKRLEQALKAIKQQLSGKADPKKADASPPALMSGYWKVIERRLKL